MTGPVRRKALVPLLAAALLSGCGGGGQSGPPVIEESERRLGAEQHPQLLAEFGGSYEGPQADYVEEVGEKLAAAAGLEDQCTFTLVNTDVVNAFAVPGCYIYVTRGLMGIVNSEAELASVLAHEVGHIVGDHSERQQKRSLWRELGVLAVGLLTGSERLTQIAGQAAQYFTFRYSRAQEYESDDLGMRYLRQAGYDPHAAADMLASLARHEEYMNRTRQREDAKAIPEWARTHPLTENRIERARQIAVQTGLADDALPENELAYLRAVDGLLYGDDPQQGFVLGRQFAHPVMRIAFEAPPGFTLTNSPQAILIEGPEGIRGEFARGTLPPGGLGPYVENLLGELVGDAPARVGQAQPLRVNGIPALVVPVTVDTQQGAVQLWVSAYAAGDSAYHFIMASPSGDGAGALDALFGSFRLLSPEEARGLRPRRIRVVAAEAGAAPEDYAGAMAAQHPLDTFRMLNGLSPDEPLRAGTPVKIITWAGEGMR